MMDLKQQDARSSPAEDSKAEKYCRHTSRISKASRCTTAEKSSASCVCSSKPGIACRTKACAEKRIRVSDGLAQTSKAPHPKTPGGPGRRRGKGEVDLPVFVFVFAPNPPKPVLCCWLLFWPKPNPPKPDMVMMSSWRSRSVLSSQRGRRSQGKEIRRGNAIRKRRKFALKVGYRAQT